MSLSNDLANMVTKASALRKQAAEPLSWKPGIIRDAKWLNKQQERARISHNTGQYSRGHQPTFAENVFRQLPGQAGPTSLTSPRPIELPADVPKYHGGPYQRVGETRDQAERRGRGRGAEYTSKTELLKESTNVSLSNDLENMVMKAAFLIPGSQGKS